MRFGGGQVRFFGAKRLWGPEGNLKVSGLAERHIMLKLYHGTTSVCSAKVRIGLAECGLDWTGQILDLGKGEQTADWYLELNPKGVVPTLVNDGLEVVESSVILEYVDALGAGTRLMPQEAGARARAGMWLAECIDIHAAINTMTFATSKRAQMLASKTPEQIEASVARITSPANSAKRRDILDKGMASSYADAAFFTLRLMFDRMSRALEQGPWLLGDAYSIADASIIAYVDRLDRLGLAGLWESRTPLVKDWLEASRARPSYKVAIEDYGGPVGPERDRNLAAGNRELVAPLWTAFLERRD